MAYPRRADELRHDRSHQHPINLTFPMNNDPEPNIFLDLRNYFGSHEPKSATGTSHGQHSHHRGRDIPYTTDYIHESSTPSSTQRYTYHDTPAIPYRRSYTPRSPRHETARSYPARTENTEYVSPWDKSDYQMIKEGGWDNKRHFMESHGLSIYEPGDFDEAKDLLDAYRRVDDESYREMTHSRYHESPYADRYTAYSEDGDSYNYCGSDSINEREDDECIESGCEGPSAYRDRAVYTNESSHRWPDESTQSEDTSETDDSSDCDSTDAIDYETEPELDDGSEGGLGTDDFVDDEYYDEYDDDSIG